MQVEVHPFQSAAAPAVAAAPERPAPRGPHHPSTRVRRTSESKRVIHRAYRAAFSYELRSGPAASSTCIRAGRGGRPRPVGTAGSRAAKSTNGAAALNRIVAIRGAPETGENSRQANGSVRGLFSFIQPAVAARAGRRCWAWNRAAAWFQALPVEASSLGPVTLSPSGEGAGVQCTNGQPRSSAILE